MLNALLSPVFLVVALGCTILAIASAAMGCVCTLKGQALIGDALGNAAFPGVVLAFMIFMTKDPLILILGAAATGLLGFWLISILSQKTKLSQDSLLAVVASSFFGCGMVLKSYISGNPRWSGISQAGLQNYIFGQASYIMKQDVVTISIICALSLTVFFLFYKEIKLYIFDPTLAATFGYKPKTMDTIILLATVFIIAAGLKVTGAILISAMLIGPYVIAKAHVKTFGGLIGTSAIWASVSCVTGIAFATLIPGLATGPTIIVTMSILAAVSLGIAALRRN